MKNYIGFVNDHSGSMGSIHKAAIKDYNENINSVVEAANAERMDTVVSVVGFGFDREPVKRQVVISNPHVLRPINTWDCQGMTPLYDGIGEMIELFESLPDANSPDVSFLLMVTTDGGENRSRKYNRYDLQEKIRRLNLDGRWTIVCRVPTGKRHYLDGLDIPYENIQEWDTTSAGMAKSTQVNKQAVGNYFRSRTAGSKSSNVFYSDVSNVNTSELKDVTKDVSLYVVEDHLVPSNGRLELRDFILNFRMNYLKGAAFYQLTKTESRVGHKKQILVRDRSTGKIYAGSGARKMLGLPSDRNARLHPGEHGNYDIFIQSESTNRLLVPGTGVIYWEAVGTPFTQAELDKYSGNSNKNSVKSGPVQLPEVHGRTSPTKSPIPKATTSNNIQQSNMVNGELVITFPTRELAREYGRMKNKTPRDALKYPNANVKERWFVFA